MKTILRNLEDELDIMRASNLITEVEANELFSIIQDKWYNELDATNIKPEQIDELVTLIKKNIFDEIRKIKFSADWLNVSVNKSIIEKLKKRFKKPRLIR